MTTLTTPKYNITENEGKPTSVTLFVGTKPYVATVEHPHFAEILVACQEGREVQKIIDLFDATVAVAAKFVTISRDVKVANGRIYLKGKEVDNSVCAEIVRFHAAGEDFKPLVKFMLKIEKNPTDHSRENLFRWLEKNGFALAEDGDILAYKGVRSDGTSVTQGPAIVNGKKMNGHIPNVIGSVIEMPREDVTWNPRQACAAGLHVGNFSYARSFGSRLVRVKVNPVDVVSVPTDSGDAKMRVCKYRPVQDIDGMKVEDKSLLIGGAFKTAKLVGTDSGVRVEAPSAAAAKKSTTPPVKGIKKKKAAPKKAKSVRSLPDYYEDWGKRDFQATDVGELKWLAKEWAADDDVEIEGGISRATKPVLVDVLTKAARKRRRILHR